MGGMTMMMGCDMRMLAYTLLIYIFRDVQHEQSYELNTFIFRAHIYFSEPIMSGRGLQFWEIFVKKS